MTPFECMDGIRLALAALVSQKATGKHLIAIDMNQGGIGSFRVFGAVKTPKSGTLFISHKGVEQLEEV